MKTQRGQVIQTTWELWAYDVWGNAEDGYDVNDRFCIARSYPLTLDVQRNNPGTPQEFLSAHPTEAQIREAFAIRASCAIQTDGDDLNVYVERDGDRYPIGEMVCTSHECLSPCPTDDVDEEAEEWPDYEEIRVWAEGDFRLSLLDTFQTDRHGKARLAYQFFHQDRLVFQGEDYCCSPLHCIDSDECVAGLLHFLSLQPGDTDREYFESYTPRQLAWCIAHGEELSAYAAQLEERAEEARLNAEPTKPEEGDYTTEDYAYWDQYGKVVLETDPDTWRAELAAHMDQQSFWPNVWFMSDHGNFQLLSVYSA